MDSNLVFIWFILMFVVLITELKYHDEFVALRDNFVKADYAKIELEDLK